MSSRTQEPESLNDLTEYLSNKFRETYFEEKKRLNKSCNSSRYFGSKMSNKIDEFRDELCTFSDPNNFSFTNLKDEIEINENEINIGMKRKGIFLNNNDNEGPLYKKQKLNNNNNINKKMDIDNNYDDSDDDSDDDDDNDGINKNKKKPIKKKKLKLNDKYKNDEDFQSLMAPYEQSQADEFFDPIKQCGIKEDKARKLLINISTRNYLNQYEIYNNNDIDLENGENGQNEEYKYIEQKNIDNYLQKACIENGFTVSKDISKLLCLGIKYHLKDMFDEMEKWRKKRIQKQCDKKNGFKLKESGINTQKWLDEINEKYAAKQQIVEAKDEIEALENEKTDLDFKKMTGLLSDEEKKRSDKLIKLIRDAKLKQKETKNEAKGSSAFDLDFKAFGTGSARKLSQNKFYSIDIINLMQNHQKYNQNYLKQLSKLCLKQV